MSLKRVNYFTHQFLREEDFKAEQEYHLEARRHNRLFHTWGVVKGLEVQQHGDHEITIESGYAIDKQGREIELAKSVERSLSSFTHKAEVFVVISYVERTEDEDHVSAGGAEGFIRMTELAEVSEHREDGLKEHMVVLAQVKLGANGRIEDVDMSARVRKSAKEAAPRVQGWLRLPFKPVRLSGTRIDGVLSPEPGIENDFVIDEAITYCDETGARGSMQIPVPPGAAHITGFRIAGTTRGEIRVRLIRAGWNAVDGKGEQVKIVEEAIVGGAFQKHWDTDHALDDYHSLSLSLQADSNTTIWLVAVKFD